jgi:hypothetical protein
VFVPHQILIEQSATSSAIVAKAAFGADLADAAQCWHSMWLLLACITAVHHGGLLALCPVLGFALYT